MLRITDTISIDETELTENFVRASGPGGQNVNKVSSAVRLRFDARHSPSLPNDVAVRLIRLAGKRATKDGVIVIVAQAHRDQTRNRSEARERLFELTDPAGGGAAEATPRDQGAEGATARAPGRQKAAIRDQAASQRKSLGIGPCGLE
jgi:ribosome-associated protein